VEGKEEKEEKKRDGDGRASKIATTRIFPHRITKQRRIALQDPHGKDHVALPAAAAWHR
jgi:hypothetical protein